VFSGYRSKQSQGEGVCFLKAFNINKSAKMTKNEVISVNHGSSGSGMWGYGLDWTGSG
jgi:hypothetical protein